MVGWFRKCLHIVGGCYREPGNHYTYWVEVKTDLKEDLFKGACSGCFPFGYPIHSTDAPEVVDEQLADGMPEEAAIEDGDSTESDA